MPSLEDILKAYGRIPELTEFKRPLFVGPHPDDIEFGCGALISRYKELGAKPVYVIVTDGGAGTTDPAVTPEMMAAARREESLKAAEFLGVTDVEFLDFPDGGLFTADDVIKALAPAVLRYMPDVIFAPDPKLSTECHADHLKTGEAAAQLSQIVPHPESLRRRGVDVSGFTQFPANITLAFYFTDDPNVKAEVGEQNLGEKIQALMLHASQMQGAEGELLLNYFKLKALKLGEGTKTGFAEDFRVLIPLMQHVYSEGIHIG